MIEKELKANNLFLYSEEFELMFAALNLLMEEPNHNLCSVVYGEEAIAALKRKYHFLFEVYLSLKTKTGMFEHLLNFSLQDFCVSEFKNYLFGLSPTVFLERYLEMEGSEEVSNALNSDSGLDKFYFDHPDIAKSFLAVQALFKDTRRLISDFFSLAEDLRTDSFLKEIEKHISVVEAEQSKCMSSLINTESLEFSQLVMGKTFFNRGPYEEFIFIPSLFVPYKAIRFFGKRQILFYSIRKTQPQNEAVLKQLKTIADDTRLKIISLLNEKEPLRGMDITNALSLAPSTVSHHIEQLKSVGLINEEPVKNSKYYSINRNNVNELLRLLTETLSKK